jgi:hypothetical protein
MTASAKRAVGPIWMTALLICAACEAPVSHTLDGSIDAAERGPRVLDFRVVPSAITEGETATFTALLRHPNGLEQLVGGRLTSPDGAITYGFFERTAAGTFRVAISWEQLHARLPINFSATAERTLEAVFLDNDGASISARIVLGLMCGGRVACDGRCVDVNTDSKNCGQCGRTCTLATGQGGCAKGKCFSLGDCFTNGSFENVRTCADYCTSHKQACADHACGGQTAVGYDTAMQCALGQPSSPPISLSCTDLHDRVFNVGRCCCIEL